MKTLSVAAIFRDEAPHLVEWIEFHRLVGVEHFYLYDNDSSDESADVLAPYVEAGIVSLRRWPGHAAQLLCYLDAVLRYREASKWIAFIDIDEFLFSPIMVPLPTLLERYEAYPAVGVNWCVFGTSDVEARDPWGSLVTETFTRCTTDAGLNRHIKSIVNPRRVQPRRPPDPHHFFYDRPAVNEQLHELDGPFSAPPSSHVFRINHYYSKSIAEACEKAMRHRSDNGQLRPLMTLLSPHLNEKTDIAIQPWLPKLRTAIEHAAIYPCAACGFARACGDPPGEDCHS